MKFLKKLFLLGLLGLAGWGLYYAGEHKFLSFLNSDSGTQVQSVKKDRAVKPKSFFTKVRDVVPVQIKKYDYTFLETLDDVNLHRYVDLDGKVKVMKKTVHSWVDGVEKVIKEPHILLASYREPDEGSEKPSSSSYNDIIDKLDDLMKEKPKKKVTPRRVPGSNVKRNVPSSFSSRPYMVQVSSFKKLSHARALQTKLRKQGYPAFIMSVQVPPSQDRWYRVFLGKYQTEAHARAIAEKARRKHKLNTIIKKNAR